MENAFKAIAVPFLAQLEIDVVREGIPVRAHLDFTMAGENPYRVRVLELKSTRNLPDALSVAYETQIYGPDFPAAGILESPGIQPCHGKWGGSSPADIPGVMPGTTGNFIARFAGLR